MINSILNGGHNHYMNVVMNNNFNDFSMEETLSQINQISAKFSFPLMEFDCLQQMAIKSKDLNLFEPPIIINKSLNLDDVNVGKSAIRFAINRRPMMYYTSNGYLLDITPVGSVLYDDFNIIRYINVFGAQALKDIQIDLTIPARVQQFDVPFKVLLAMLGTHPQYGHIFKFISNDIIIQKLYANSDILQVLFPQYVNKLESMSEQSSKYLNLLFIINGFNIIRELTLTNSMKLTNFRAKCYSSFLSYGGNHDNDH